VRQRPVWLLLLLLLLLLLPLASLASLIELCSGGVPHGRPSRGQCQLLLVLVLLLLARHSLALDARALAQARSTHVLRIGRAGHLSRF
jgi:hypothetical protein